MSNNTQTRLIISGFGCPKSSWENFFPGDLHNHCLTLSDMIGNIKKPTIETLATSAFETINKLKPVEIALHDFGLTAGLLSLIRIHRKYSDYQPKLIIFNGAFTGFNIFKNRHPFWIQFQSLERTQLLLKKAGGNFDESLKKKASQVRFLYLDVIKRSVLSFLSKEQTKTLPLPNNTLLIISENDPFIDPSLMTKLNGMIRHSTVKRINYGHYPYSQSRNLFDFIMR